MDRYRSISSYYREAGRMKKEKKCYLQKRQAAEKKRIILVNNNAPQGHQTESFPAV